MLYVFICDETLKHRSLIESFVNEFIKTEGSEMQLAVSTGNPDDILTYLKNNPGVTGLYFLDVDLKLTNNGIELAASIKEIDTDAGIIFVSSHSELAFLTYEHKVEALDYIIKNNPRDVKKRAFECMKAAYKSRFEQNDTPRKYFVVKSEGEIIKIAHSDILFFTSHPSMRNKIIIYLDNGSVEYRGHLSDLNDLEPEFFRCNQSYVVNVNKLKCLDKTEKEATLVSGDLIPVSVRRVKQLAELMTNLEP